MSATVDVEEIQTTKSEKLLAVVLAVFLLIGGLWVYAKIDDVVATTDPGDAGYRGTAAEQAAIERHARAQQRLVRAQAAERAAAGRLVETREAYRTALEAGRPSAPALGRAYDRAQARLRITRRETRAARAAAAAAEPGAEAAERHIAQEQTAKENRREVVAFVLRLGFVLANLAFGYFLLARLRRRASRYYALSLAFLGYAVALALVMAGDYLTDYFDPVELGPLVLSLIGIAATVLAFVGLQRYLARRTPYRRVRKGECPFCGYPARDGTHCEGCGRAVQATCARCGEPRRVGTRFCGACGAA